MALTCDQVIEMALLFPETSEFADRYGITVKRGDRGMIWMIDPKAKKLEGYQVKHPDGCIFAFRVTWEKHDELLDAPGSVFWKKPHYRGYPALLVDTSDLDHASAQEMLKAAWEGSIAKTKMRKEA